MEEKNTNTNGAGEGPDWVAKREEFLETFFRRGAEFVGELLTELQLLRDEKQFLAEENERFRHQLASDDAIRDLLTKIEDIEKEKSKLRTRIQTATEQNKDFAGKYAEMEKELDAMANLYVASYQLHDITKPQEVLGIIEQLLAQLVGVGSFAIYLRRECDGQKLLEPVHAYHCEKAKGTRIPWDKGRIGEAASTQVHYLADPEMRDPDSPLACIPMVLRDETVGVIVVYAFLEQKERFVDIDFELFKLLALHAASAIVGAGLMEQAGDIRAGIESYVCL